MLMRYLALMLACLLIAACGKEAPQSTTTAESNAPRPVAEQEKEIADRLAKQKSALDADSELQRRRQEREQLVAPFIGLMDRFDEARARMSRPDAKDSNEQIIASLDKIKTEVNQLPTDSCVIAARDIMLSSLDKTRALIDLVKDSKEPNSPQILQRVNEAFAEQSKARQDFNNCLNVS